MISLVDGSWAVQSPPMRHQVERICAISWTLVRTSYMKKSQPLKPSILRKCSADSKPLPKRTLIYNSFLFKVLLRIRMLGFLRKGKRFGSPPVLTLRTPQGSQTPVENPCSCLRESYNCTASVFLIGEWYSRFFLFFVPYVPYRIGRLGFLWLLIRSFKISYSCTGLTHKNFIFVTNPLWPRSDNVTI